MKRFAGNLIIAILGGGIALSAYHFTQPQSSPQVIVHDTEHQEATPVQFTSYGATNELVNLEYAAAETVNAVVHISNEFSVENYYYDPLRELLYGEGRFKDVEQGIASGSGVIISQDGYIVTNNHVIEDADELTVTLNDNRQYTATVIGSDPATDLALVKIDAENLHYITLGNSDNVAVGQWVLAVGNPFNLTSTVTAGIVSAKARNINLLYDPQGNYIPLESFIQTDAAVNPGNSGGALVSATGELIGINTAIASQTGSYAGYSFAVPVNIVHKVTLDLMEYGEVKRAFIGVTIQDVTQSLANQLGIDQVGGVYVAGIMPDGAAGTAGIETGDIITMVDGARVTSVPQLQEKIGVKRPGNSVEVTVKRDGAEKVFQVTLRDENGNETIETAPRVIRPNGHS